MNRFLACFVLCVAAGCIKAPEIVLVDRATALEQQAAGSFPELEGRLMHSGLAARPVPLTPDQLQALGIRQPPLVDNTDMTDADQVDALLKQSCIGEARDGTLVDTSESCRGAADRALAVKLLERTNQARQQLWRYLQARQPATPPAELRRAWRAAHPRGVVCGGREQQEDGKWESKPC
ncbi:MAG TPA: DUF1318 domain-containing protein [Pseudomonadota bacterium]|nr:DUF1318 domain-containing protein [Pseudomonadota bacterium]